MILDNPDGRHFRAARAWFGLSRDRVAAGAGLDAGTVGKLETDSPRATVASSEKLRAFYARSGVLFLLAETGGGIRIIGTGPRTVGAPGTLAW